MEIYERLITTSGETPALLNAKGSALLAMGAGRRRPRSSEERSRPTAARRRCTSISATRSSAPAR
jgi:hypothetical protein